jgi:membrane-bound metal-dependent hydrolase YbcI (DUF457 family)
MAAVLGGHRGLTHTALFAWAIIGLMWRTWPEPWVLAFGVGYVSHLLADLPGGVPLLWPIWNGRIGGRHGKQA